MLHFDTQQVQLLIVYFEVLQDTYIFIHLCLHTIFGSEYYTSTDSMFPQTVGHLVLRTENRLNLI